MSSPGRDPVTIQLSTPGSEKTLKDKPFQIKEGAKFTMSAEFKVQHEILSGLHYVQVVKRKGIKVSKDSEMIVSWNMPESLKGAFCWNRVLTGEYREATLPTPTSRLPTSRSVCIKSTSKK